MEEKTKERLSSVGCVVFVVAFAAYLFLGNMDRCKREDPQERKQRIDSIRAANKTYFDSIDKAEKREEIDGEIFDLEYEGYHVYRDWNEEFVLMWENHDDEIEAFIIESLRENHTDQELVEIFGIDPTKCKRPDALWEPEDVRKLPDGAGGLK